MVTETKTAISLLTTTERHSRRQNISDFIMSFNLFGKFDNFVRDVMFVRPDIKIRFQKLIQINVIRPTCFLPQ